MSTTLRSHTMLSDRYRIERELGRGGMATVYLAHDVKLERDVAVKVLNPDLSVALGPERFRREIDLASHLSHPHILTIDDFGESNGALYYVMPYVTGETLATRLQREKQLGVEEAVRITCQVASALDHAHRQGIIHRDIKPENILLQDGQALVADFGIAKAVSESADEKLTQTGVTLGTPTYMSPEQAMAERSLDGRSDVYSLGCVLYEMLAGQPPFVGPTAQAIIARHTLDQVPSITVVRGTVPEAVEDAVMRALAKVPADRFSSAAEFAESLQESLRTGGRSLGRSERRTQPRRGAPARRRAPWMIAVAALVVVAAAVGVWRLVVRWRPAPVATADLPPQRIAVMYFADESKDHALSHVADGLTEELIRELALVQGLDVVSRNGVAAYRGDSVPVDSVARALGAGTLVRGSVEEDGSKLRVSVRLVDGGSGADYKRSSFEVPVTQLLSARDTLAHRIADFLRQRLGEEISLRESRLGTTNVEAWSLLQRAEQLVKDAQARAKANDSTGVVASLSQADTLLTRAQALDGNWVQPVVASGQIALRRSRYAGNPLLSARFDSTGMARAERAVQLDPNSAEAWELRGAIEYDRWAHHLAPDPRDQATLLGRAETDLKTAVRIDPSLASAWSTLALVYYQKPDLVEATLATRRAYESDAYLSNANVILWRLFTTAYDNESFVDAVHWCDEGGRRFPEDPNFVHCQLLLFTTSAREPRPAEAWKLVDRLHQLTPEKQWGYVGREARMWAAVAIGRAGLKDSADHVLENARGNPQVDPEGELIGIEAAARGMLGERDTELELLKRYLTGKPEHREGFRTTQSWWWRDIRSDPRFRELIGAQ